MQTPNYEMFTSEGNQLVTQIVLGGPEQAKLIQFEREWEWKQNELHNLSYAEGYEEATDTAVREAVYDKLI